MGPHCHTDSCYNKSRVDLTKLSADLQPIAFTCAHTQYDSRFLLNHTNSLSVCAPLSAGCWRTWLRATVAVQSPHPCRGQGSAGGPQPRPWSPASPWSSACSVTGRMACTTWAAYRGYAHTRRHAHTHTTQQ